MSQEVVGRFPNSLVLVLDPDTGSLPLSMGGSPIAASPSGITIGTLSEYDGETTVVLAGASDELFDPTVALRWQGRLNTSGRIGLVNVRHEVLLVAQCPQDARVSIATNDSDEPSLVWIVVE